MGLSLADFLEMTPLELAAYSDGYQRRANREAWLHGIYVMYAIMAIVSPILSKPGQRAFQYPDKPDRELAPRLPAEVEADIKRQRQQMHDYLDGVVRSYKERGRPETEAEKTAREEREILMAKAYMHQMSIVGKNWGKN